jgi:hypothetical protein
MPTRTCCSALVLCALIAASRPAAADEISFDYGFWGYTVMGDTGFQADHVLWSAATDGLTGGGTIRNVELVSRTFGTAEYPNSYFEFGSGTFSAELSYTAPDGTVTEGTFVAPITGLSFVLHEEILFRGGNGYGDPGVHAVTSLTLERGFFSSALAKALHIHRKTLGGDIDLYIEGVGDPISDSVRAGVSSADIDIEVTRRVPEPSVTLLIGVALILRPAARRFAPRPQSK